MNNFLLDPWADAAAIAMRLERPNSRLVVIVGAEAWCSTCQTLKPIFETVAEQEDDKHAVFLWLDLEEHAEFLDEFIPPSLPLLLVYRGGELSHAVIVSDPTIATLKQALAQRQGIEHDALPNIHARMRAADWAN